MPLNFNGNTNYVSLGNSISGISDGTDAFSFAAWINPTILHHMVDFSVNKF